VKAEMTSDHPTTPIHGAKLEADGLRLDAAGKLVEVRRDGEWVGYMPRRGDEGDDKA